MTPNDKPAEARLGESMPYFVIGAMLWGLALLCGAAAAGGSTGAAGFGALIAVVGSGLLAAGFWIRLFRAVELRLIDIEARLASATQVVQPLPTTE